MAQASKQDPNKADVADRIEWFGGNADAYKENYAEGTQLYGPPKTVDPFDNPDENTLDQNGFVGTDPIYQNYASVSGRPLEDGDKVSDPDAGSPPDLEDTEDDGDEDEDPKKSKTPPPPPAK